MITIMLPVLLQKTQGPSQQTSSTDIRFLSLKIFTDIVIQYLSDDSIYEPSKDTLDPASLSNPTRLLSSFLQTQLFPRLLQLLQDVDPLPLFALKLLSAIVERNPAVFARQMRKQEPLLMPMIADYYQVGHPRLNRHTINILKAVIHSKELSLVEVQHYRLGEKTVALLKSAVATKTSPSLVQPLGDWCTEILLDVLQQLLASLIDVVSSREAEVARLIDEVLGSFDLCVTLLSSASLQSQGQQQ